MLLTMLTIQGIPVDARDEKWQETALMQAAGAGRSEAVKFLIQRGAQLDLRNHHGATALCFAAFKSKPDCLEILAAAGADVDLPSGLNTAPVLHAASDLATMKAILPD